MKNKKSKLNKIAIGIGLTSVIFHFSFFISATPAYAAQTPNCELVYGGGATCEQNEPITINKQIQNPANEEYVDSLPPSAPAFSAGQTVRFKLTVANTGTSNINKIVVTDIFPAYLDYAKGSGKFDAKTRTFTFTIDTLNAKSNKVYFVEAKVASADKIPENPQITCVINQSKVQANNKTSQDNVKLCVSRSITATADGEQEPTSKGGLPIYPPTNAQTTPPTGPEALALFGLAPLGALGFYLRSKACLPSGKAKT